MSEANVQLLYLSDGDAVCVHLWLKIQDRTGRYTDTELPEPIQEQEQHHLYTKQPLPSHINDIFKKQLTN
ncbi:unnamed protein product [Onchocerca flexuosa]|uniref:Uncharacterized protein n=1 Tax=Onchocerca flexuosa TaxID=387005 RepID=A0A183I2N9_9BILA|nr:unnamed protein product [Onchocerca flexuosa]